MKSYYNKEKGNYTNKNIYMKKLFLLFIVLGTACMSAALMGEISAANNQPIETGLVQWGRNFEEGLRRSEREDKPVLALFQEVPGCSGTQEFGKEVLSNPLLVEAIENEFIPILIYNNRGGRDAELLARYHEPSWNFQVIRFLDSSGKDIIPRRDRIWTLGGVARRMAEALKKAGRHVPLYLQGLANEHDNPGIRKTAFAMFCFWTGEMKIGGFDGVVKTEAGYYRGREVTQVWYDERLISLEDLVQKAAEVNCADAVYVRTAQERARIKRLTGLRLQTHLFDTEHYRKAGTSDQKKQIQGSPFTHLDLTPFQITKINAFAPVNRKKALKYLSPGQAARLHLLSQR
jgi:hypothetical protein